MERLRAVAERGATTIGWRAVPTALLLVLFNLVPVVGVTWLRWDLRTVLLMYWLESGVIGLLNVPRLLLSDGHAVVKAVLIPFFVVHYGLFWAAHGVLVAIPLFGAMAGSGPGTRPGLTPFDAGIDWSPVVPGAVGLVGFHLISFLYWELWRGEARRHSPQEQMTAPYQRVIVLLITILGGAIPVALTGQAIAALLLLVCLKTAVDVRAHVSEHRRRSRDAAMGRPNRG